MSDIVADCDPLGGPSPRRNEYAICCLQLALDHSNSGVQHVGQKKIRPKMHQ